MAKLVSIASTGRGTWAHLIKLIDKEEWEAVYVVTDEFGKSRFPMRNNIELIIVNFSDSLETIRAKIIESLKGKINDWDVGLNLFSGDGKSHMALLSALISLGLGIRMVYLDGENVKEV